MLEGHFESRKRLRKDSLKKKLEISAKQWRELTLTTVSKILNSGD